MKALALLLRCLHQVADLHLMHPLKAVNLISGNQMIPVRSVAQMFQTCLVRLNGADVSAVPIMSEEFPQLVSLQLI